ncbi:hypothetical protein B0A48_01143 [Cryoendolithus antarcticus]|uniref:Uncharacterized protein n=1 Tax=Cryoendolithus antarcticus TaxID=1507870 RepID=A0A1V8TSG7_9PEZI|nr:hypothetical protein B0A48_01143 [Cryoendolithus antarcticus]
MASKTRERFDRVRKFFSSSIGCGQPTTYKGKPTTCGVPLLCDDCLEVIKNDVRTCLQRVKDKREYNLSWRVYKQSNLVSRVPE